MGLRERYSVLSARTKGLASTGAVVFAVAIFGGLFSLIEIGNNVRTIVEQDDAQEAVVIENKSGTSAFELIGDYRSGGTSCFFTDIEFQSSGQKLDITEERWREEDRSVDVIQYFDCISGSNNFDLTIANLIESSAGDIQLTARGAESQVEEIAVEIIIFDWNQNYCFTGQALLGKTQNEDTFEANLDDVFEPEQPCELVSVDGFGVLGSSPDSQINQEVSAEIDQVLLNSSPEECQFVAATLSETEAYPKTYDQELISFINSGYQSWEWFAGSAPLADDYVFDDSLSAKLDFHPTWHYSCETSEPAFSISFGGFVNEQVDGVYSTRVPKPGEIYVNYSPWTSDDYDLDFTISTLNQDLQVCETLDLTADAKSDSGSFYMFRETVFTKDSNIYTCPIISLDGFSIYLGVD